MIKNSNNFSIISNINYSLYPINNNKIISPQCKHNNEINNNIIKIINTNNEISKNNIGNKNDNNNNNQQIKKKENIIINKYINKQNIQEGNKIIKNQNKEKDSSNNNSINLNSNQNINIEIKRIKKQDEELINKNKQQKTLSLIDSDPDELEKKQIILTQSIYDNNNTLGKKEKNKNNKKKISFDDIITIVKYYENDNIKKSFIFTNKDYRKITHKFLTTKEHIKNLKKLKIIKSILLVKKDKNTIKNENLNLALLKLNELISEVNKENNNKNDNKENNNKIPSILNNDNYIKTIKDNYKKGFNYKCLSKSEINLLKRKKKYSYYGLKNNPQNILSKKLSDNVIKTFRINLDDNDLLKINKNGFIYLGNIKKENESNSYREEKREKNLSMI